MAIRRPAQSDIAAAAEHFGLHLDADQLARFTAIAGHSLVAYDAVDELYDEIARPQPAERAYAFPDDNPLGAWYVTTEISAGAGGPLAGRRVAVKDNIAVAGVPMMNGSRTVEGFIPGRDATVVQRLLDAGAVIAGKSVCEDLCYSGSSFTSASGPVRNPWDPTRETGGSSSGSAALVAAGEVELALGGDQGGSVRIPAALCGIVGHKPTYGLVPYTGAFPIERTLDHIGPITRSVADAALLLGVLAGSDGQDPRQPDQLPAVDYPAALTGDVAGLRVGILAEGFGQPGAAQQVDELVRASAQRFAEIGCTVAETSVPWHRKIFHLFAVIMTDGGTYQMLDGNGYGLGVEGLYDPELMAYFAQRRRATADQLPAVVKVPALCGRYSLTTLGGASYAKVRNLLPHARGAYDTALQQYDVLVMPTVPSTAATLPTPDADDATLLAQAMGKALNTAPMNVTGHPAISVPVGIVDGLPVGMMIMGRRFDDATVLRVAHAFEELCGGFPMPGTESRRAGSPASH
ncbi:amidase [Mycobacterium shimoidei]|uniref:amidase n=1 Tax=Mycobacterium shimoidei TaxID=29313 RepID=UPI0008485FFC|nr:amidase [Mycobacterium shimoidei]MCV7261015.1 amidase [Mycobacterium shimoidei]ODR13681.1 amidase [Mycobacterium shimoidei]ORW76561.1 amidase [Mycobacterium shimoidei]